VKGLRLSALLVNYASGPFALACARSLVREWQSAGGAPDQLELIVVDNASPTDQGPWLTELERAGACVVASPRNLGYAGGIECAFARSSGGPDDYVAVLNPDVVFLPGSLRILLDQLERDPSCGVVAPRAFVDEACTFELPPAPLPCVSSELAEALAELSPPAARFVARRQSARARAVWSADEPHELEMLAGACLLLPRSVAEDLGTLLDPRYPLYFEDADLCRRVRARGLSLVRHPAACVLHHWSRSAGAGAAFEGDPRRRWHAARRAYHARFAGGPGRALVQAADTLRERWPRKWRGRPAHALALLPTDGGPLRVPLPLGGPFLLELATAPTFGLCAGAWASGGGDWCMPAAAWSWLFEGAYYLRALDVRGRVVGAWAFTKRGPARTETVLELDERAWRASLAARDALAADAARKGARRCA
jgi:hypothetical protein